MKALKQRSIFLRNVITSIKVCILLLQFMNVFGCLWQCMWPKLLRARIRLCSFYSWGLQFPENVITKVIYSTWNKKLLKMNVWKKRTRGLVPRTAAPTISARHSNNYLHGYPPNTGPEASTEQMFTLTPVLPANILCKSMQAEVHDHLLKAAPNIGRKIIKKMQFLNLMTISSQ